jgi:hypothetical protein
MEVKKVASCFYSLSVIKPGQAWRVL